MGKGYQCAEFYDCAVCYKRGSRVDRLAKVVFLNGSDASVIGSYSVRPQYQKLVSDLVRQNATVPGYVSFDGMRYIRASFTNMYAYLKDFLTLGTLGYTGFWLAAGVAFLLCI